MQFTWHKLPHPDLFCCCFREYSLPSMFYFILRIRAMASRQGQVQPHLLLYDLKHGPWDLGFHSSPAILPKMGEKESSGMEN